MEIKKPSFEKDLWGQCNKLHERLGKKIDYYKILRKSFEPIYNLFGELNKKINSMKFTMDPTIPVELYTDSKTNRSNSMDSESKWYGIPLTMKIIKEFIANCVDFNSQTLFHVITNLETLINKMKQERNEYEDFLKSLNVLSDSKKTMEKNMKLYHIKMFAAEQSVLDLKKIEVKNMSINKDATLMIESKDMQENKAKELTDESIRPFKIYKDSVIKANELREESINIQKNLLYTYQEIEEETGKINKNISNIFFSNLKFQKEFIEETKLEIDKIKNNINIDKDIRQLIINYSGNEEPEEEIPFINFPSTIDFDKSDTNETFQIYVQSINYIKSKNEEEYPNYNQQLEMDKNDMRETTYKIFSKYSNELEIKLKNFIKNKKTHSFFLILLSKLRTNNRFQQNVELIDLLGIILNNILNVAEKDNNYDNAKNCIILSQTFFCEKNNEKYYLIEKIRNHKWLTSSDFWYNFIDTMIAQEIDRFTTCHPEVTKDKILDGSEEISDKMKFKLSELLFSQLLPYVNNMNEFNLGLKNIVQITEAFSLKYKFLKDEHKESIFGLFPDKKEEIEKIRKECKNKNKFINNNNITNNNKKNNQKFETPGFENNSKKNNNSNKTPINNFGKNLDNNKNANKNINNNEKKKDLNNNNINSNKNNKLVNDNILKTNDTQPKKIISNNELKSNSISISKTNEKKGNNIIYETFSNVKNNFNNFVSQFRKEEKKEEKKEDKNEEKKENKKEEKKEDKKEVKKQENKKISSESKKDIKQETKNNQEIKNKRKGSMKQVMIGHNVGFSSSQKTNPFGVVLKKVPTNK